MTRLIRLAVVGHRVRDISDRANKISGTAPKHKEGSQNLRAQATALQALHPI